MLAVQTFCVACNPLVRHANFLGFQNLTLRSSFGDLAFPHVFWRRGRGLGSSLQVAAWLWPWLFCSQLWDLLSRKRWVARVWTRAAGWLCCQMDALHRASLSCNVLYTLLYLLPFHVGNPFSIFLPPLVPQLVSICKPTSHHSPFSSPSTSGFLSSALLLLHFTAFLTAYSFCHGFSFLPNTLLLPHPDLWWQCMLLCKYFCKTNQLSWQGGEGKHLGVVCLDIIRTQCKMCSAYTRLETYFI